MINKGLVLLAVWFFIGFNANAQQRFNTTNAHGLSFLQLLVDSNFNKAEMLIDSGARQYYTALTLQRDWYELIGNYGEFKKAKPVEFMEAAGLTFIQYLIKFDYLQYILSLTFNQQYNVGYVAFAPAHQVYFTPDYADIGSYRDTTVVFTTGLDFEFPGTLTLPYQYNKKIPVVIIMGDAGPTDKDFSMNQNKPYKDIAVGLATKGYAVFRFDKRAQRFPMFLLRDKIAYNSFTCREDYLDDLYSAINKLKTIPNIDAERIFVLGHGQGGNLAPLVAKERKDVKGILMLGAHAVSQQELLLDQYNYLMTISPQKFEEYDEVKRKVKNTYPDKIRSFSPHDSMPNQTQATYFIWLNAYKPIQIIKKIKQPVLIMHFNRDYQVNEKNIKLWQQTLKKNKNATIKQYPKLNHLMYEGEGPSTYSDYFIKSNIPVYLINDMADWLNKH